MTKAILASARFYRFFLAGLLATFCGAAHAQAATYVGVGVPVMTYYGSESVLYDASYSNQIIAPFAISNVGTLAQCNANLANYATAAEAAGTAANGGYPYTYSVLGGCLGIGPAANAAATSWVMINYYDGNYMGDAGGLTVILPLGTTTACSANKTTIAGWFSSLPNASALVKVTCL